MKAAKPRQVGAWIVLAVLVAFLCAAIAFMVVGWGPGEGERGQEMSTAGYVAMVLGIIRQRGGKQVEAFALEGAFDPERLSSNTFEIEWPPRSGRRESFPEVDRAAWFSMADARVKILDGQRPLLDRLEALLSGDGEAMPR